jgi:hypothetical protein
VAFQRGDRVLLPWVLGNHDPSSTLEFDVMVSAVLPRMPDHRIEYESSTTIPDQVRAHL